MNVTGARPGGDPGKRELFTEATTSVLVFENGGVIRLAADVVVGQLLFLTHRDTKQEVVAQVTRRQALPPDSSYTEVEFTDAVPGFWGIEIPARQGAAQPGIEQTSVQASKGAGEEAGENSNATTAAKAQEVERLKQELVALAAEAAPGSVNRLRLPNAAADGMPRKEGAGEPRAIAAEEPRKAENGEFSAQDLFPPVALDFSQADKAIARAAKGERKAVNTSGGGALRFVLLGAGLVAAAAGAAWHIHWLPRLSLVKPLPSGSPKAAVRATPTNVPVAPAGAQTASGSGVDSGSAAGAGKATSTRASTGSAPAGGGPETSAPTVEAQPAMEGIAQPEISRGSAESAGPVARENAASSRTAVKRGGEHSAGKTETSGASTAGITDATVPPKLIQSVRAVAPTEAVRQFVTGNVIVDAVVDDSGHVKSMTVLSGPASLRNAAQEALKQYRYEPATRNGKAVPAHVRVTVQFWYEP